MSGLPRCDGDGREQADHLPPSVRQAVVRGPVHGSARDAGDGPRGAGPGMKRRRGAVSGTRAGGGSSGQQGKDLGQFPLPGQGERGEAGRVRDRRVGAGLQKEPDQFLT